MVSVLVSHSEHGQCKTCIKTNRRNKLSGHRSQMLKHELDARDSMYDYIIFSTLQVFSPSDSATFC